MLIRVIVKNLFSFKDYTEFNMLSGRSTRMPHHLYNTAGLSVLKLNAMYGANGAGKSNLIKALDLLKNFVKQGNLPIEFITETYKFDTESRKKDVYLGIEFIKDSIPFYYGLTLNQGIIIEEELQVSGLGKKEDRVLFRRTDEVAKKNLHLVFDEGLSEDKEAAMFPSFLQNELMERNKPTLFYLQNRQSPLFEIYKKAFDWLNRDLTIIAPATRHMALALLLEKDEQFFSFATNIMRSFNTGIKELKIETLPVEDFFGQDDREKVARIIADFKVNPEKIQPFHNAYEMVQLVSINDKVFAKRLSFLHEEDNGTNAFTAAEESDGTRRLLDYLPALYNAIHASKVYIVDEIERSIHPLLIKELIRKFSQDETTKGQLIFTTHESNLLDQDIFRPDEIWFAEKKPNGSTELYVLSEFKEHHTKDIRKGYLNGRYGAIPFLSNLQDLKWDKYAEAH